MICACVYVNILKDPCLLTCCVGVYQEQEESLKDLRLSPVRENNVELLQEILRDLDPFTHRSNTAAELARILTQPHFQVWIEVPI